MTRRFILVILTMAAINIFCALASCGRREKIAEEKNEVLLIYEDSALTCDEVFRQIPVGLPASDSAAMFRKIVAGWLEEMVLADMAKEKLPDIEEIERKVKAYRNRLIVMSYLSNIVEQREHKASEESVRRFYDSHKNEMVTEHPLVKGVLLKVPENVRGLDEIKRCVFTGSSESLDELERRWATDAVKYDYFEHTWVDWQVISEQIPYRFYDPDAFLESTRNFETENRGTVYLLHISEYLPTGSEMPYEFAQTLISAMMERANVKKFEDDLVKALIKRAISEDRLKAVGYDPVEDRMLQNYKE